MKHTVNKWFVDKSLYKYFNENFKRNKIGNLTFPRSMVMRFNGKNQTISDDIINKMTDAMGQSIIDAIVKKHFNLTSFEFAYILPDHQEYLKEAVCNEIQKQTINNQTVERTGGGSISTPSFNIGTEASNWVFTYDELGIKTKELVALADIANYKIIGDSFVGDIRYRNAKGTQIIKVWNNEELGKEINYEGMMGEAFDTWAHVFIAINNIKAADPEYTVDKYDYVLIEDAGTKQTQVWRYEGGPVDTQASWDRKDTKAIDGNRYLVYKQYTLVGAAGRDGKDLDVSKLGADRIIDAIEGTLSTAGTGVGDVTQGELNLVKQDVAINEEDLRALEAKQALNKQDLDINTEDIVTNSDDISAIQKEITVFSNVWNGNQALTQADPTAAITTDVSALKGSAGEVFKFPANSKTSIEAQVVGTTDHKTVELTTGKVESYEIKSSDGTTDVSFKLMVDDKGLITMTDFNSKGTTVKTPTDIEISTIDQTRKLSSINLKDFVKQAQLDIVENDTLINTEDITSLEDRLDTYGIKYAKIPVVYEHITYNIDMRNTNLLTNSLYLTLSIIDKNGETQLFNNQFLQSSGEVDLSKGSPLELEYVSASLHTRRGDAYVGGDKPFIWEDEIKEYGTDGRLYTFKTKVPSTAGTYNTYEFIMKADNGKTGYLIYDIHQYGSTEWIEGNITMKYKIQDERIEKMMILLETSYEGTMTTPAKDAELLSIASTVADNQFSGETSLTEVNIPFVITIGQGAFIDSPLVYIDARAASTIGDTAFAKVVNAASTVVYMKSKFNTDAEKDRIFGPAHWNNITFYWM